MKKLLAIFLLSCGSVFAQDPDEYQCVVLWTPPTNAASQALDTQAVDFIFTLEQTTATGATHHWVTQCTQWTGIPGYSTDGGFTFRWDTKPDRKPSPPSWFDGSRPYKVKFKWNTTLHTCPEVNPFVTYSCQGDSVFQPVAANKTYSLTAFPHLWVQGYGN